MHEYDTGVRVGRSSLESKLNPAGHMWCDHMETFPIGKDFAK